MNHIVKQFLQREAHPVIQFVKYGMAGTVAASVDICTFYLLSFTVFPAITSDDSLLIGLGHLHRLIVSVFSGLADARWVYDLLHFDVVPITESVRERNYVINRSIVFFISNFAAYVLNMLWVFTPGRHRRHKEILLFFVVAISSFAIGTSLGWGLIYFVGLDTTQAFTGNILVAVMINFVARKYLVFKR